MSSFFGILLHTFVFLIVATGALVKFKLPKTDIVHLSSGLVMRYTSEFRPANKIVTFTVTIPMYSDMCYLVPNVAMGKIPQCLEKEATMRDIRAIKDQFIHSTTESSVKSSSTFKNLPIRENLDWHKNMPPVSSPSNIITTTPLTTTTFLPSFNLSQLLRHRIIVGDPDTIYLPPAVQSSFTTSTRSTSTSNRPRARSKRFLPAIIAIGFGIAQTALNVVNYIQTMNMKSEMKDTKESLRVLHLAAYDNHAQIIHINEGQLKFAQELGATQVALNKTIDLVNQHSDILRLHSNSLKTLISQTMLLRDKLATATQAMESHFIHESTEDILANKLNLYFVHHQDLPKVVNVITQALNLSTSDFNTSVPLIEIITRLLVRQQIDFAPSVTLEPGSNDNLIGKLMFTSYFAAPDRNESPFSIYELFPIPFKLRNNRVTLAKMPAYLGIEHLSQQFIHWSRDEARFCDFKIMPFCRESPIQRKEYEDDCLYQILTDSILENCRIELFCDKIFIHQIGQYWAISPFEKSQCHYVSTEDVDQHIIMNNKQITLPEIVLIRADYTRILACDRYTIPRRMINISTPINLIYNASITAVDRTLINLQEALVNNTQCRKLPYLSSELHAIIEFLNHTPTPIIHTNVPILANHPLSLVTITIVGILILVVLILIYYISRMKKTIKSKNNLTVIMPSLKQLLASET